MEEVGNEYENVDLIKSAIEENKNLDQNL